MPKTDNIGLTEGYYLGLELMEGVEVPETGLNATARSPVLLGSEQGGDFCLKFWYAHTGMVISKRIPIANGLN